MKLRNLFIFIILLGIPPMAQNENKTPVQTQIENGIIEVI